MMTCLKDLTCFLNQTLDLRAVLNDASNNGLQIEGREIIKKAIFSVDFSLELADYALENRADFIFVHHGQSWGNSLKYITGSNYKRIKPLIEGGISLYGAHLPLDRHPLYGHNAVMAQMIGLRDIEPFWEHNGVNVGFKGILSAPMTYAELSNKLLAQLKSYINENSLSNHEEINSISASGADNSENKKLSRIAIVSGGGGMEGVICSIADGADCFITGEFSHSSYYTAKEAGLSVMALGHYLTETPGIIRMMHAVKDNFPDIDTEFINIPTGLQIF